MKEITVINGNIVREDSNFFKAVQCIPRNPKARCENCAFDDGEGHDEVAFAINEIEKI